MESNVKGQIDSTLDAIYSYILGDESLKIQRRKVRLIHLVPAVILNIGVEVNGGPTVTFELMLKCNPKCDFLHVLYDLTRTVSKHDYIM